MGILQVQMNLVDKNRGTFSVQFERRITDFENRVHNASRSAAAEADRVSKKRAKGVRAPQPPRPFRQVPSGTLAKTIQWKIDPLDKSFVALDVASLDAKVRWWRVQEVGTGKTALMKRGGKPNPRGNAAKGNNYRVRIKSQRGRVIPASLVFVSRNGIAQPFSDRSKRQALVPYASAKQPKGRTVVAKNVTIRNEIEGKHFIREGAREGFRDYKNDVLAAARATLGKR